LVCIYLSMITLAWMLVGKSKKINQTPIPSTKVVEQLTTDWSTVPFVDVTVRTTGACSYGESPMFEKTWDGLLEGCFYVWAIDEENRGHDIIPMEDILEEENTIRAYETIPPSDPRDQTALNEGKAICGHRRGLPFTHVKRVDL